MRRPLRIEILEDRITPTGNLQSILGLSQIQSSFPNVTGAGETVALLDTGINYNLPSLGGGEGPGYRVVYAYNFLTNTAGALDDNGHGTFLANMIGSANPSDLGIAPKVQFADLKVLDSNMNGNWTAIENALAWVIANKTKYNIVAVNMSFGSGNYAVDDYELLESDLATLKSMGVFIAAASGNNYASGGSAAGLAYPAVDPDVVSVGATWAGSYGGQTFQGATDNSTSLNQFADFTQRDSSLSILAPGAWITTIGSSGTETTMGGTSMATAVVTGAAVLLHQELDQAGLSAETGEQSLLQLMQSTGTPLKDDASSAMTNVTPTGLTFKELNLQAALEAAVPPTPPTIATIANQTMQVGQPISVPVSASHAAGDPVTLHAQIVDLPALAYQLKTEFGLTSNGNYFTNYDGDNEKWISGSSGGYYWLLPTGALYHYTGASTTIAPANLVGTLNASFYANPALLWNAAYAANPPAAVSMAGNAVSIQSTGAWLGSYSVLVTATDALGRIASTSFTVTVNAAPPALAAISTQTMAAGQTSITIPLSATNATTISAAAETPSATLYQLNQQYGLTEYAGSYYQNLWGQNEKWLVGKNGAWYMLLPNGQLYRWAQSVGATLQPANLIANVGTAVYAQPELLWNAQPPAVPKLTFTATANELTIHRPAGLTGVFLVDVTAGNGTTSVTQTFELVLN